MAVGDVVEDLREVGVGEYLEIRPINESEEWVIHNVYCGEKATLVRVKEVGGTSRELELDSLGEKGGWYGFAFHVKRDSYLRVRNDGESDALFGYDGVVTKV